MDCKLECASRTLLRIECIELQGFLHLLFRIVKSVLAIPLIPFVRVIEGLFNRSKRWYWRIVLMPVWFSSGLMIAIFSPFRIVFYTIRDMSVVARAEWYNRWRASTPKLPNGRPLYIMSDAEELILDEKITQDVIRDYNIMLD